MYNINFNTLSKRGYLTLLALLIAITAFGQEITVNGVVIDETDTPLIGATVQVKNSQKGVVTDFDGKFSIKANNNATLIISYIGYKNQELIITQKVSNVTRNPNEITLIARVLATQPKPVGIYFVNEDIFTLASYYQTDMREKRFFPSPDWQMLPDDQDEERRGLLE